MRWSESDVVKLPDKNVGSYSFTSMLSIRVTDFEFIWDGVVICGTEVLNTLNLKSLTYICAYRSV